MLVFWFVFVKVMGRCQRKRTRFQNILANRVAVSYRMPMRGSQSSPFVTGTLPKQVGKEKNPKKFAAGKVWIYKGHNVPEGVVPTCVS